MTEKQAFMRVLKELGIYRVYLEDLKVASAQNSGPSFPGTYDDSFSELIDWSFVWSRTRHMELYKHLHNTTFSEAPSSMILDDEYSLMKLRKIVHDYINIVNDPEINW